MIAKCVLGLLVLVLMINVARRHGVNTMLAAACMLPVASGLAEFWCARPQMAS